MKIVASSKKNEDSSLQLQFFPNNFLSAAVCSIIERKIYIPLFFFWYLV